MTVPKEHFDCASIVETKEPKITREDSPTAYRLDRPVTGILSIKPLEDDTTESEDEEVSLKAKEDEGQLYVALYTSEKSDYFCKFLKFNRSKGAGWQHELTGEAL